jgi:predicted N-acetyltransferase YhbS
MQPRILARVISPELAEFAECPSVYSVWPRGFRRVLNERYCLVLGPSPYFSEVQRPRLGNAVAETLAEVRALAHESEHASPVWWVGNSATPADLVERLEALGLDDPPDRVGSLVALAIEAKPEPGPADVDVRIVETLADYIVARNIIFEAFDAAPEHRGAAREHLADEFRAEQEGGTTATFVAFLEGVPVASGRAAYCQRGGLLFGGATLAAARGRGAYRALVRARWDDAARRGTPALVTQAAPTSEPILRRLGFEEITKLRRLRDPQ